MPLANGEQGEATEERTSGGLCIGGLSGETAHPLQQSALVSIRRPLHGNRLSQYLMEVRDQFASLGVGSLETLPRES
jgi:hypothetical protein